MDVLVKCLPNKRGSFCKDATGQIEGSSEAVLGKYGKNTQVAERGTDFMCICLCFVMFATSPAWAIVQSTRGGRPKAASLVEAAEGRLHYGCWGGGKRSKNISKCI